MRKLNLIERRMSTRKKYVKPTIKSVEWKFQDPVCNSVCQLSSKCITSEQGSINIQVNQFGGELEWTDYDSWKNRQ